jgi:hypothetical protein
LRLYHATTAGIDEIEVQWDAPEDIEGSLFG